MSQRGAIAIVFVLFAVPAAAANDPSPELREGSRVRVTRSALRGDARPERFVGALVRLEETDIVVQLDGEAIRIPLDSIETLELRAAHKRRTLLGAAVGAGAGLALGALLVASLCEADSECGNAVTGVAIVTGTGALLGAAVGAAFHSDEWRAVPLDRPALTLDLRALQVGVHASRDNLGAQLSLRF
jgi:hypothetical protein